MKVENAELRTLGAGGLRASIATLVLLVAAASAPAQEPAELPGHWEGAIEIPGSPLAFDVDLVLGEDGAWSGDISIPAQGAKDVPLKDLAIDDGRIRFVIPGVPGEPTFDGAIEGEEISGDFTQGGQSLSFSMSAGEDLGERARAALEGIDEYVEKVLATFGVPGAAVSVVAGDEVVLERGYGVRDVESGEAVTADTLFAIGSTSKAFTAFVLGTLVDEGLLEWDEPVREYLPDFRLWDEHATQRLKVRDLLIHSSGLPRHDLVWYGSDASRAELFARLRHLEPTRDLGEEYQYQNLMFMTAGWLAERITGKTWEELVRERIFEPLGIERANFSVEESGRDADAATPHQVEDRTAKPVPFRNIDAIGPAGSINASATSASKWMQMLLSGGEFGGERLIESATLREMVTNHMAIGAFPEDQTSMVMGYGLGWVLEAHRGKFLAHHGGGIDGFISWIAIAPRERFGVAVYTNGAGMNPVPTVVGRAILDRVLGLAEREEIDYLAKAEENLKQFAEAQAKQEESEQERRIEGTSPSRALAEYAGEYEHPGYGAVKVTLDGESLALEYNGMRAGLEHWHYDTFSAVARNESEEDLEDTKILFRADVDGHIVEALVALEQTLPPIVLEKAPDARLTDPGYLQRFVGRYQLDEQIAVVSLAGDRLKVALPGQPVYTLEPEQGSEFALEGLPGFSLEFQFAEGGEETVSGARFIQPNGIFEATRIEE
mgnify:FL=1